MKQVITSEKKPIKLWLDDIEDGALEQAKNLANLPFTFKHVAIMPDAHQGYGMPIGGVLATEGVVIPNAVGVDNGCGMCAVQTPWKVNDISRAQLVKIKAEIEKRIPVGFSIHKEIQSAFFAFEDNLEDSVVPAIYRTDEHTKAGKSIGTLGGGNHFIEIQKDTNDNIWIMIHSGSRNLGFRIANHYNKVAIELNKQWYGVVPKEYQLAYLPVDDNAGKLYLKEMQYAVEFAFANRKLMMERVKGVFENVMENDHRFIDLSKMINIAHNYARWENHFGKNVIVHRKGATSAKEGEIGIIPGSQGSKSYIVMGLGNVDSFKSCSHGAGRTMGRKQAIKSLNLSDELQKMGNVIHNIKCEKDLDESVGAYKDIDVVMENQNDLVKVLVELTPLAVVKG